MYAIKTKRVYAPADKDDGTRVLVDRMWPRAMTKEKLAASWNKLLAPSQSLCKALSADQIDFCDFSKHYYAELDASEHAHAFLSFISSEIKTAPITLLYASKDEERNHADLLKNWLHRQLAKE